MLRIVAAVVIAAFASIAMGLAAPAGAGPEDAAGDAAAFSAAEVEALQWRLLFLGYDVGRTDGVIGPNTRAAIRAFERDQGLPETGEPTAALLFLANQEGKRRRQQEWDTLRE